MAKKAKGENKSEIIRSIITKHGWIQNDPPRGWAGIVAKEMGGEIALPQIYSVRNKMLEKINSVPETEDSEDVRPFALKPTERQYVPTPSFEPLDEALARHTPAADVIGAIGAIQSLKKQLGGSAALIRLVEALD